MSRRSVRVLAVACIAALFAVACGGGDSDDAEGGDDTAVTTTTVADDTTTTTEAADDTTTTTTAGPDGPTLPLTGLPGQADQPVVAVKIDNHPSARPQVGLNVADVVFEEIVESNITRFIGIFHSADADPVGPVRSARTSDIELLTHLDQPLFANSGGNAGTLAAVRRSDLVNVNVNAQPGEYFRDNSGGRFAPHNLFTNTSALREGAPDTEGRPPALFDFLPADEDLSDEAVPAAGVELAYGGVTVVYEWSEDEGGWLRTQAGTPHVDADEVQVAPTNVVVLETNYGRSAADPTSPEAIVTGTGRAWVFTRGTVMTGTWTRPEVGDVAELVSDGGEPMPVTPGTTWVAFPRPGDTTVLEG